MQKERTKTDGARESYLVFVPLYLQTPYAHSCLIIDRILLVFTRGALQCVCVVSVFFTCTDRASTMPSNITRLPIGYYVICCSMRTAITGRTQRNERALFNGAPFSYRNRTPHLYEFFLLRFVIWLLRAYKYRQLRP